jgi:release factor glutamine methyltransferase
MWTVKSAFCWINKELKDFDAAPLEAELLLRAILKFTSAKLYHNFEYSLSSEEIRLLISMVEKRKKHYPLAYLLGQKEFFALELLVNEEVMIPRPESEFLVEIALTKMSKYPTRTFNVVDLGTGSGCIAVSIAYNLPHSLVYAVDISEKALTVARANAYRYHLEGKIVFLQGDLFQPLEDLNLKGKIDSVISNPPYIPSGEFSMLPPEIRNFEPRIALDGGEQGFSFYPRIIEGAIPYLRPGGWIILELGPLTPVSEFISNHKEFGGVEIKNDYAGIPRILISQRL